MGKDVHYSKLRGYYEALTILNSRVFVCNDTGVVSVNLEPCHHSMPVQDQYIFVQIASVLLW